MLELRDNESKNCWFYGTGRKKNKRDNIFISPNDDIFKYIVNTRDTLFKML
jgi:hypothetical protein